MKIVFRRLFNSLSCLILVLTLFAPTAFAANSPAICDATTLIDAVATRLNLSTNLSDLVEHGIITPTEKAFIERHHSVTRAVAWRIALPAYDVFPYPAEIYPDIEPAEQCVGAYANARAAAIKTGLATPEVEPNYFMSETELAQLLHCLETNNYSPLPSYTLPDCPYLADGIEWTIETYSGRNSLLSAWNTLPRSWRNDFIAEDWQIKFSGTLDFHIRDNLIYHTAGCTDYHNRVIEVYSYQPAATLHEFVHYVARRVGWDNDFLNDTFFREASSLYPILGAYSQVSPNEYLAEFTTYWLLHPEKHDQLQQIAPQTADFATQLIENYETLRLLKAPPRERFFLYSINHRNHNRRMPRRVKQDMRHIFLNLFFEGFHVVPTQLLAPHP